MPATPKLAGKAASEVRFPTWDEMVAEATVDLPTYELPLGEDDVLLIPIPDGDRYLNIVQGQRVGNAGLIFENLIPDKNDRERLRIKMRGAHFPILDVLSGKVLRYYYGLSIADEEKSGNSSAS